MTSVVRWVAGVMLLFGVILAGALVYVRATGLRARATPGALESRIARAARSVAIPARDRNRQNPVPRSVEAIEAGLDHFADHCASCHANDGSGTTDVGRGLFPPPPDLRAAATQEMTDGALFYVIENGVRFTGMPAFGTGSGAGEEASWQLVRFIRHLPQLSEAEEERMKERNPRSSEEIRQEIAEQEFLRGTR